MFLVMEFGWNSLKNILTYNYIIINIIIVIIIAIYVGTVQILSSLYSG